MKKTIISTVVASLMLFVGFSTLTLSANDIFKDISVAKTDPYGFSPKVVAVTGGVTDKQLLLSLAAAQPTIGCNKLTKLIEWGDSPALMAGYKGDLGKNDASTMKFAKLNRKTTILVASIGGSGGAPMSQTGVSISDGGSI